MSPRQQSSDQENTKKRIIDAAKKLFAANSYDGTSVKEICSRAKVNIAAIHYHFGSKEELLRYLLESFGGWRLQSVQRILSPANSPEELRVRLKMFISEYFEAFTQEPELTRIVQAEIELLHSRSEAVFKNTFLKLCSMLSEFIDDAIKKGFIYSNLDPVITARCLFSQLAHQTRSDRINLKFYGKSLHDKDYREKWAEHILVIFLNGVSLVN
jgi:AcrR family transcriptional regulator